MTENVLRGTGARPDRNSREAVESAIELSKGGRGVSWGSLGRRTEDRITQWETSQPKRAPVKQKRPAR